MIYKITVDFKKLEYIINILKDNFDIIIYQGSIYICKKNYKNTTINQIKKNLNIDNNFIENIDETILKNEDNYIQNWCSNKFVEKDLKSFEKDKQDEIKKVMKIIDNFENELKNIVRNNK